MFLNFKVVNEDQLQIEDEKFSGLINDDLRKIIDAIKSYGFDVRVVGGAVRDILLNRAPRDIDIITNALPEEISYILSTIGLDSDNYGIKHGTVKALVGDEKYEITSLDYRITKDKDGKIKVSHSNDWRKDAERRDFTMNAMSMDLDGNVYDYFGGIKDIEQNILRPLPDFETKILLDPVVMLRFFRFVSRMPGVKFPKEALDIITRNKSLMAELDADRVEKELNNIRVSPNATKALELMNKIGLLDASS